MSKVEHKLEPSYVQALQQYLAGAGESALRLAYELGRKAVTDGLGVLEVVAHHDEAAQAILRNAGADEDMVRKIAAMHGFLIESLSPFEITHRSFHEANAALYRLNEVLEEETKRIARMLHDDATQLLAAVHIALADLAHELPPRLGERIQEIRGHLDQIERKLRNLSHELRPTLLDDLGLMPALEFLSEGMTKRTGLMIAVEGSTDGRLPPPVETTLYRIVQEGLVNATKHARAGRAMVGVAREPRLIRCAIRDNGIGFDVSGNQAGKGQCGLGLIAVRERLNALGGTLQINSSSQHGTELLITIPLEG
jgi:signal transduction histidine kinase